MGQDMQPFDWGRIFLGDMSPLFLLEILFRTVFMYAVALLAARFIGKRGMGQLTPFEYIVVIAMGSTAGTPMMEVGIPLLHGSMVLVSVVAIDSLLARWAVRSPRIERLLESEPTLLISAGVVDEEQLVREKIGLDELKMMLRLNGVERFKDVETAYLEPSGDLSIFLNRDANASSNSDAAGASNRENDTMP